jgi:hypothetical protein
MLLMLNLVLEAVLEYQMVFHKWRHLLGAKESGAGIMEPKPFFIPSYLEGIQQYPKDLRKVLEVETRKYNAKK